MTVHNVLRGEDRTVALNQQQETNQLRILVNLHIDQWIAAGNFFLPNEHDCLRFIVTEAVEALQAEMRINAKYVRNNPAETTGRDVAIELFDTMMMCLVFERITEKEFPQETYEESFLENMIEDIITPTKEAAAAAKSMGLDFSKLGSKTLDRIIYNASRALIMFDDKSYFEFFDLLVVVSNVYHRALTLIKKMGCDPLEIAREKLERKSAKLKT